MNNNEQLLQMRNAEILRGVGVQTASFVASAGYAAAPGLSRKDRFDLSFVTETIEKSIKIA